MDGCRGGWYVVALGEGGWIQAGLFPGLAGFWEQWAGARLILIDMPIGLPENGDDREREREARRLLGGRRSSIFPVPCREAVCAASPRAAVRAERSHAGRGLSRQSLGILPRIRELDRFLMAVPAARRVFRESHPELCFLAMNRGRSLEHGKKSPEGRRERLAILRRLVPDAAAEAELLSARPAAGLSPDDVVDACALAAAACGAAGPLVRVPAGGARVDAVGLVMGIVHPAFEKAVLHGKGASL